MDFNYGSVLFSLILINVFYNEDVVMNFVIVFRFFMGGNKRILTIFGLGGGEVRGVISNFNLVRDGSIKGDLIY